MRFLQFQRKMSENCFLNNAYSKYLNKNLIHQSEYENLFHTW